MPQSGIAAAPIVASAPNRTVVIAPGYHAAWVGQSDNLSLAPDAVGTVTVRFRNTGSVAWIRGAPQRQANLGVVDGPSPLAASSWPTLDRVAIQTEPVVQPGEIATFTFQVRAPSKVGSYRLDLRPVIDGTTWMENEGVYVVVTSTNSVDASQAALALMAGVLALFPSLALADWLRIVAILSFVALLAIVARLIVAAVRARTVSRAAWRA